MGGKMAWRSEFTGIIELCVLAFERVLNIGSCLEHDRPCFGVWTSASLGRFLAVAKIHILATRSIV